MGLGFGVRVRVRVTIGLGLGLGLGLKIVGLRSWVRSFTCGDRSSVNSVSQSVSYAPPTPPSADENASLCCRLCETEDWEGTEILISRTQQQAVHIPTCESESKLQRVTMRVRIRE